MYFLLLLRFTTGLPPCYVPSNKFDDTPIHSFSLPPGSHCRDYCMAINECEMFLLSLDDVSFCALFKEPQSSSWMTTNYLSNYVAGRKSCLVTHDNLNTNLTEIVRQGAGKGIVLQRTDSLDCLGRGEPRDSSKPGFYVVWSSRCNDSIVWSMTLPDFLTFDVELRIKDEEDLCLAAELTEAADHPKALVMPCKEPEVFPNSELGHYRSRGLVVGMDNKQTSSWSIYSLMDLMLLYAPRTYRDGAHALTMVHFVTGWELMLTRCQGVQVRHGRISAPLGDQAPFFVAGYEIRVECNDGYGWTRDGFSFLTQFSVACSRYMAPVHCTPLPKDLLHQCLGVPFKEGAVEVGNSSRGPIPVGRSFYAIWVTWFILIVSCDYL